jgi:PAS domain S-box-containing protein
MTASTEQHRNFLFKVFDRSGEGFWMLDEKGVMLDVNKAFCKQAGYSRNEILMRSLADWETFFVGVNLRTELPKIESGQTLVKDCRFLKPSGSSWDLRVRAFRFVQEGVTYFGVLFQDRTLDEDQKSDNHLLLNVLSLLNDTVIITDKNGVTEWVNESFSRNTGYTLEEAVGRTPGDLLKSGKHSAEFYEEMWKTLLNGEVWSGDIINTRKDGKCITEQVTITPLFSEEGDIDHFVGVKQDLTELKNTEELLKRAQRLTIAGALASGAAHDLNNILSGMILSAEHLQGKVEGSSLQGVVAMLKENAKRASQMMGQFIQVDQGEDQEPYEIQLKYLLRDLVRNIKGSFPNETAFDEQFDSDLPTVFGCADLLQQVFGFCLLQVAEGMPTGGGIRIEGFMQEVNDQGRGQDLSLKSGVYVVIRIQHDGWGYAAENQDEKDGEKNLSDVLGYVANEKIIKEHKGAIFAKSTRGKVEVYLPVYPQRQGEGQMTGLPPGVQTEYPQGNNERILVVDDEETIRTMLKFGLSNLHYEVELAENGQEAIDRLCLPGQNVDLVLLDLMMPHINGYKVLEYIEMMHPRPKILLMSGFKSEGSLQDHASAHHLAYMLKPFTMEQLCRKIRTVMESEVLLV